MMTYTVIRPVLGHALYFILIGPLVGLLILLSTIVISAVYQNGLTNMPGILELIGSSLFLLFWGFIFAYLIGGIPALLTGLIAGLAKNQSTEIAYAIVAGGLTCLIGSLLINTDPEFNFAACVLGSISGLTCTKLRHRRVAKFLTT